MKKLKMTETKFPQSLKYFKPNYSFSFGLIVFTIFLIYITITKGIIIGIIYYHIIGFCIFIGATIEHNGYKWGSSLIDRLFIIILWYYIIAYKSVKIK